MKRELFVESSALVALVLWEAGANAVAKQLRAATAVWISALAPTEASRALLRAQALVRVDAAFVRRARAKLSTLVTGCRVIPVDADILERAAADFPIEPIRTLDAIHLASLERARSVSKRIALLSLDERVRSNAVRLGVSLV
jgi:PIN domain nuclease of toxin-antitoxin system